MNLTLPDAQDVVRRFLTYEAFSYYPVTYYLAPDGSFTDVPGQDTLRIDCYVYFVKPDLGLVLYRIGDWDSMPITGFKYVSGVVLEHDSIVPQLVSEVVESVFKGEIRTNLTRHEKAFLSLLIGLEPEVLDAIAREAYLMNELADRTVAVFSDFVVVLSKRHLLKVYEGEDAVRIARRVSFIVDSPVYSIAEHIKRVIRTPATFFYNEDGYSVICNYVDCNVVPLPPNIARSVASILAKDRGYHIYELGRERRRIEITIPADAVVLSRRGFFLVERIDENNYQARKRLRVPFAVHMPILVTRSGWRTYCKPVMRDRLLYFEVVRGEARREEGEEDFAEEIILGI